MVAIAVGAVALDGEAGRIHEGIADMVAGRVVAADGAFVRVHVVHGEAQVAEAVVAEHVVPAGDDEDAVAAVADVVVFDHRARRVPDADAIAALAHLPVVPALDMVAADDRGLRPFQVDADQVALEPVVLDHGARGAGGHEDAAVLGGEIAAGAGDRQPAQHHLWRIDGDHAPHPTAVEDGTGLALERQGTVDDDRPGMAAGGEQQPIAGRRGGDGRGQPAGLGGDLDRRRVRRRRAQQDRERDAATDRP